MVASLVHVEVSFFEEFGRFRQFRSEPDHFSTVNLIARETVVGGLSEQISHCIRFALVLKNTLWGHGDTVLRPYQQIKGLLVHLTVLDFDCWRADF